MKIINLLKKSGIATCSLLLLCQPVLAQNLEVLKIEDTFTFNNIKNTIDGNNDLSFIITSTGIVKAKGTGLYGVGDTIINSDKWLDILVDRGGTVLDNIVKLDHHSLGSAATETLQFLNTAGNVFKTGRLNKIFKDSLDEKIVDMASRYSIAHGGALMYTEVCYLTESGDLWIEKSNNESNAIKVDAPEGLKFKKIYNQVMMNDSYGSEVAVLALSINNDLYKVDKTKKLTPKPILSNVDEVFETASQYTAYVRFLNGSYWHYNVSTDKLTEIDVGNNNILDIVSDNSSTTSLIVTTDGVYTMQNSGTVGVKTSIKQTPVAIKGSTILCSDGKYYELSGIGPMAILTLRPDHNDISIWANENPIVSNRELAHFNIDPNSILKRHKSYDIEFSLVTKDEPNAFNLYYAKSSEVGDKSKWIGIEQNVPVSALNPRLYDTNYVDSEGQKVEGKTYTYVWTIGQYDLTNIQLIVEPIY